MSNMKGLVAGVIVGAGAIILASPYGENARKVLLEKFGQLSEKAIATAQAAKQRVTPAAVPAEGAVEEDAPKTYIDIDGVKQKVAGAAQKVSAATASYAATAKERGAAVAEAAKQRGAAVAETAKGMAQGNVAESAKDDELRAKIDEARARIAAQIAANAEAAQAAIEENAADVAEKVAEAADASAAAPAEA